MLFGCFPGFSRGFYDILEVCRLFAFCILFLPVVFAMLPLSFFGQQLKTFTYGLAVKQWFCVFSMDLHFSKATSAQEF